MGLSFILPESPRWCKSFLLFINSKLTIPVAQQERYEEFDSTLRKLYEDEDDQFFIRTKVEIREQIQFEAAQRSDKSLGHALVELFVWKNIRRTAMAIMVMQVGILSGSLAIQNYQGILYASLGFHDQKAILISGCYGFMGIAGQIINLLGVSDRWSRKRTMCKIARHSLELC
jgi:Sugar (and other) transporter